MFSRRGIAAVIGLAAGALLAAGCTTSTSSALPPACTGDSVPPQPGVQTVQIDVDGQSRSYRPSIPSLVSSTTRSPALLVFNGPEVGQSEMDEFTRVSAKALDRGFVVIQPEPASGAWAIPGVPGADDVRFVESILYDIGRRVCVAPDGLYATGFDNGAGFAMWLTCALPRFAGVAPVSGVNLVRPCDGPPLSVVAFHDNDDALVPFAPPPGFDEEVAGYYLGDVLEDMSQWAERSKCDADYTLEQLSGTAVQLTWPGCAGDTRVTLYSVTGIGHNWPGASFPLSGAAAVQGDPGLAELGGIVTDVVPEGVVDATALLLDVFAGDENA